jgi:hypothetical protein
VQVQVVQEIGTLSTLIAATTPLQSAAEQHWPHLLPQQYGRALSPPPDVHCVLSQHSAQPTPGQHTVPLLQPLR